MILGVEANFIDETVPSFEWGSKRDKIQAMNGFSRVVRE